MRTQSENDHALFIAQASVGRFHHSGYMAVLFISIRRMRFLVLNPDNADPLFVLVMTPGFYRHQVEVADQDPGGGSLY